MSRSQEVVEGMETAGKVFKKNLQKRTLHNHFPPPKYELDWNSTATDNLADKAQANAATLNLT